MYIYVTYWLVYPHLPDINKGLVVTACLAAGIGYCGHRLPGNGPNRTAAATQAAGSGTRTARWRCGARW